MALRFYDSGSWWLFDCGEGTQHRVVRSPLKWGRLEAVFITHLHGDHLFGLPGLLATRSLHGLVSPLPVFGPPGVRQFLETTLSLSETHLAFDLPVVEVADGWDRVWEDGRRVRCAQLCHGVDSFGFRIEGSAKPGRLRPEKAQALGIPPGPAYGRLKRGETVILAGGRKVEGREVTDPPQPGRTVVVLGDTEPCRAAVELARGADVLVHEATFAARDEALARRSRHASAREAARVAREAGVKTLVLTHVSPRYAGREGDLLAEAREVFSSTVLVGDGQWVRL